MRQSFGSCVPIWTIIAISLWVQELVNLQMQKMRLENEETIDLDTAHEMTLQAVRKENVCGLSARHQQALLRDMTPEQLYAVIAEEIDEIYANG